MQAFFVVLLLCGKSGAGEPFLKENVRDDEHDMLREVWCTSSKNVRV